MAAIVQSKVRTERAMIGNKLTEGALTSFFIWIAQKLGRGWFGSFNERLFLRDEFPLGIAVAVKFANLTKIECIEPEPIALLTKSGELNRVLLRNPPPRSCPLAYYFWTFIETKLVSNETDSRRAV